VIVAWPEATAVVLPDESTVATDAALDDHVPETARDVPSDIVAVTANVSVPWILSMSVEGLIATDTVVGVTVVGDDGELLLLPPPPPHPATLRVSRTSTRRRNICSLRGNVGRV
jgi:hypothetical protein